MDFARILVDINRYANIYFLPVLIVVGIVGNSTIAVVFWRGQHSSTSTFFFSLALSDLGYTLSIEVLTWLHYAFGIVSLKCNTYAYFISCFFHVSNITVAAVVMERVLAVKVPHRVKAVCTHGKSVQIAAAIWCAVLLTYSHMLAGFGDFSGRNDTHIERVLICEFQYEWYAQFMSTVGIYLEMILVGTLEMPLIIVGNIIIIVTLFRSHNAVNSTKRTAQTRAVTLKTMTISLFHLVCIMPMSLYPAIVYNVDLLPGDEGSVYPAISELLFFCSHFQAAFNIILYTCVSTKFRDDLKAVLCGRCLS